MLKMLAITLVFAAGAASANEMITKDTTLACTIDAQTHITSTMNPSLKGPKLKAARLAASLKAKNECVIIPPGIVVKVNNVTDEVALIAISSDDMPRIILLSSLTSKSK